MTFVTIILTLIIKRTANNAAWLVFFESKNELTATRPHVTLNPDPY